MNHTRRKTFLERARELEAPTDDHWHQAIELAELNHRCWPEIVALVEAAKSAKELLDCTMQDEAATLDMEIEAHGYLRAALDALNAKAGELGR